MFRKKRKQKAIKKYITTLPSALKQRYGGSGKSGYTEGQVTATIKDLKLNQDHLNYALLIFCGEEVLLGQGNSSESILKMTEFLGKFASGGDGVAISAAGSSGLLGGLLDAGGGGDSGGMGDGGGGGGGGGE